MKKFEDFSKEDLWKLRCEVSVNSLYYSDYHNSFGLDTHSVCDFFDGWLDFIKEQMMEDGHKDAGDKFFDYFDQYDNAETLEQWYYCFDDFSWVKYNNYTVYVGTRKSMTTISQRTKPRKSQPAGNATATTMYAW